MARKSMGLLDVIAWLESTGRELRGRRASNFYFNREEGHVLVKLAGLEPLLIIEGGKRVHETWRVRPPQEFKPYPLVVLLRKRARGSRVEDVRLLGEDRIVEIVFSSGVRLVAELVPRGVIALLDGTGRVLASDKTLHAKDRTIRPGVDYKPPPSRPSLIVQACRHSQPPSPEALAGCTSKGKDLVRGLVRGCGVQGEVAEEAIYRAGLDPGTPPASLERGDLERLADVLLELCKESLQGRGYLVLVEGAPVEATPFNPQRYREKGEAEVRDYDTFDAALDTLFSSEPALRAPAGEQTDPELARLEESLRRAEERAREYRETAELLRRAAAEIPRVYDKIALLLETASQGKPVERGNIRIIPAGKSLRVEILGVTLEVPRWSTPDKLVVELYKKAGELEAKAERALSVREEVMERISELRLRARAREIAEKVKRRKRYWFEKYHWTITRGGMLAIGGRDASQNEAVVKKYLQPGDLFLHANIHGAPAVVLKTGGRSPSEEDLWDAAVLTAAYSRAWKAGAGSVEVYWASAEQVSFSPPSGEYLAKGGIMVYGRKHYLPKPVPVRIAVGIGLNEEGVPIVFQGSEETVRERTIAYAVLAPGDMGKEEAARELKKRLASAAGSEAPLIYAVPDQEIMPRIPGRARILRISKGGGARVELSRYE